MATINLNQKINKITLNFCSIFKLLSAFREEPRCQKNVSQPNSVILWCPPASWVMDTASLNIWQCIDYPYLRTSQTAIPNHPPLSSWRFFDHNEVSISSSWVIIVITGRGGERWTLDTEWSLFWIFKRYSLVRVERCVWVWCYFTSSLVPEPVNNQTAQGGDVEKSLHCGVSGRSYWRVWEGTVLLLCPRMCSPWGYLAPI